MKQFVKAMLMTAMLFASPLIAQAADQGEGNSHMERVGEKLGVGIANVATGVVEIPKTIMASTKRKGVAYGATAGFITGLMQMMGRTLCGTLDLVTFMIPTKSLVHPEYVWNNFNKETSYTSNFEMRR